MSSRLFAYNSGAPISGASQSGSLAISNNFLAGGSVKWWNGPNEQLGYVIAYTDTSGTRKSNGVTVSGGVVGFRITSSKTDSKFLSLANNLTGQNFLTASVASNWLNTNGYYSSYSGIIQSYTAVGSVTWTAPSNVNLVEYLLVAGGGGGGNGYDTGGGAGGGGGMVLIGSQEVTPGQSYTITVGFGGTGGAGTRTNINGTDGGNSSFGPVISLGGKGGNGSRSAPGGVGVAGVAQVSSSSAPTAGNGGGNQGSAVGGCGGGGGGAFGNGTNGTGSANNPGAGGIGGSGTASSISGASITYGVGGNGAKGNTAVTGAAGSANTGKGGGGGSNVSGFAGAGGNGGSGIVIIKY
jgi:hypothetical protein